MKPVTLLLSASLIANVAFVAFVATRSGESPSSGSTAHEVRTTGASAGNLDALRAALASGDAAALKAAGVPADIARDLALGRALARFQQKVQAARTNNTGDGRWWRSRNATRSREEELLAQRELSDALINAYGDDLGLGGTDSAQLSFLSADKRAALRRISQDYNEMMAKFGTNGIQLASDKEKLRLLRAERDRDIAALLTPSELADYQLRTSATATNLRNRYGDAIDNEDDFKKLYTLQKAFDDKFPADAFTGRVSPDALKARSEAQAQLQTDIQAALGDDKYAAIRRATDPELKALDSLVSRIGLPADTTTKVAASRDTYAAESQRINADTSLSFPDRRAKLQDLGNRAKAELTSTLGAEAADAFAQRANWVGMLQNGLAFSTSPSPGTSNSFSLAGITPSVYPVMPTSTNSGGPGSTRQVVNITSSTSDSSGSPGGAVFFGGNPGTLGVGSDLGATRSMQVISVSNSSSTTPEGTTTTTTTTTQPTTPTPKP